MAGCVPCFIIPLILFIFHRYIQPIILRYWNPWENKQVKAEPEKEKKPEVQASQELLEKKES
jgi:hypothetical protein